MQVLKIMLQNYNKDLYGKNIKLQQLLNQYERNVYLLLEAHKISFIYFTYIHSLDIYTILNKSEKEEEEQ